MKEKENKTSSGKQPENIYVFKFITIGDSGCGKTSIVKRFVYNEFRGFHDMTIGIDFASKSIIMDR